MRRWLARALSRLRPAGPEREADRLYRGARRAYAEFAPLLADHRAHFDAQRKAEAALSRRGGTVPIHHAGGDGVALVAVATTPMFLDLYNFRESFVDPTGLNARQRQLVLACRAHAGGRRLRTALFEHGTALHRALEATGLRVTSSHYVEDLADPHRQDMQALTYPDGRFDLVVHADVLEHVPDQRAALAESFRVLAPGGATLFTTPVFPMERSVLRAEFAPDGALIRHHPDEIHGDNLTGGVLAFHNFGWGLVEDMRAAGFADARVETCLEPRLGLYSSNCPLWTKREPLQPGNMLPLVLAGGRPA